MTEHRSLSPADYQRAAAAIGVDVPALRAVIEVEAAGAGFIADGRPTILFEAHVFHRASQGRFAGRKDRHGVALSVPKWDKSLYGRSGAHQWQRLEDAARLNWDAAHKACSWGLGQVLGTNHVAAGHANIATFVEAMKASAGAQLDAMVSFLKANKLDAPLRAHDWARFARGYNGPGYKANKYDQKLSAAYRKYAADAASATPTLRLGSSGNAVRDLQHKLSSRRVLVDGTFGPATEKAVKDFQADHGLAPDGVVGPQTWAKLG